MFKTCVILTAMALATSLLTACGTTEDVEIAIKRGVPVSHVHETPRRIKVLVSDIRKETNMERTTLGGLTLGKILLKPPAPELVQTMIETKADEVLTGENGGETPTVYCGIRVFDISTPVTPLYWDVTVKIELVLRLRGRDRTVSGLATERTYLWPSGEIIQRATQAALDQVAGAAGVALKELNTSPP